MPSTWDSPDPTLRPAKGMLDDAYRREQEQAEARRKQQNEMQAIAPRQRAEIAEFLGAMRQLRFPPRTYRCYSHRRSRNVRNRWVAKPTSEVLRGWHIGSWSAEEVAHTNLPVRKPSRGSLAMTYLVVTEAGELRSTNVDGRFSKSVPIPLPYVHHYTDSSGESITDPLFFPLREAVRDIVKATGGRA